MPLEPYRIHAFAMLCIACCSAFTTVFGKRCESLFFERIELRLISVFDVTHFVNV